MSQHTTEPTREQGNAIELLSILHAERLAGSDKGIKVYPTSPRPRCIQATMPWGESLHINEDGITIHRDFDHSR